MLSRRAFLHTSGVVAIGTSAPAFLGRAAAATAPAKGENILVVVELTGGNDGLNTVVPFKDADYAKYRPNIRIDASRLRKVNDSLGLHPALSGFSGLLEDGCLSIVQGVGYPNPSQSHFRSMDVWQAGSTEKTLTEGWLGKALKKMPAGTQSFHLKTAQPSPLAFDGAPMRVPSIATLDEFRLLTLGNPADAKKAITGGASGEKKPGLLDFVTRTAASTYASSERLAAAARAYTPKVPYPDTQLGGRLRLAAQLIEAGVGARIFYVSIDGFDTHATQLPAHEALLTQVSGAMTAFYKDMKARGNGGRVMMMTFSEFGRRAKENGSKGTDHGSGSQMFLVGSKVKAGLVGAHPDLSRLDDGNLTFHTDFRSVYAAILERWLGVTPKDVLGREFKPAAVFA